MPSQASIEQAVPLVRRALKVLSDREVSPQLGLLKSTLLQLDSTFSERTYGAGSFRDFAQKLAAAGHVVLRESGPQRARGARRGQRRHGTERSRVSARPPQSRTAAVSQPQPSTRSRGRAAGAPATPRRPTAATPEPRTADGIREVRRLFQSAQNPPRWPMYIRQAKQFLRNVDASFDERKFGFASLVDLLRACQREGCSESSAIVRASCGCSPATSCRRPNRRRGVAGDDDNRGNVAEPAPIEERATNRQRPNGRPSARRSRPEVVEGDVVQEMNAAPPVLDGEATLEEPDGRHRNRRARPGDAVAAAAAGGKSAGAAKAASEPRSRGPTEVRAEGAAPRRARPPAKPRAPRDRARRKETPAL